MKKSTLHATLRKLALLCSAVLCLCLNARAGIQIPYTPTADTLHLWHLDDPNGLYATDAVTTASITLTNLGLPTAGTLPYTNTVLGAPGFTSQGTCNASTSRGHLLYGGAFTGVSQFANQTSGAFTFEALMKFDTNPLGAIDAEIVSGDNGGALGVRGWQWRIFNGDIEWDLLAGSTDNDFKAHLPTTGPNAATTGAWYHVAITYTGNNPTNGDTPNIIKFYWTLADVYRVSADLLGTFTATRPLDGSPLGTSNPGLGVGGSARNTTTNPGNNEGLIGSIDEVRISNRALASNEMAFVTGGACAPPIVTLQPPANTLVAYGKTLIVSPLISATPPISYQWVQNGNPVTSQTNGTLIIPNATFAQDGSYKLVITNDCGSITTAVAQVTVGASASEFLTTGLTTNGVVSDGDIPDPNWILYRSDDPNYLGPDAPIFENSNPLQFASPNGGFSPTNGISMWIGVGGNPGGAPPNSPAGQYIYRSNFLLDQADPATMKVNGNIWVNGTISDILVNGKSTGVTIAPGGTLYVATYSITNGFVAGMNTVDFVETITGATVPGIRVQVDSVALALPPGLPVVTNQPVDRIVRDAGAGAGSKAKFSVVAIGRPPLNYQWYADGAALSGATNRTLTFQDPTNGGQGTNFKVVVSNDSGSVTSSVAKLTIVSTNQSPVAATFNRVAFSGQTLSLSLSEFVQSSPDPDGDTTYYSAVDGVSTNGAGVNQVGATVQYAPTAGFAGLDEYSYYLYDLLGGFSQGYVRILALLQPTNHVVSPGGNATFSVGLGSVPSGYTFQWRYNGTNIAGATGVSYTVSNAQAGNAGSYTVAVTDGSGQTYTSGVAGLSVFNPGTGIGLTGDYYNNITNGFGNFTGAPTLTRVDPTIDFDFLSGPPDPSIAATYFMIRWHGQVQPYYSGLYTFTTTSDDGARLWVNGQLVVNRWQTQSATAASGTINLTANQKYDIVLEYFQQTAGDVIRLAWASPNQVMEIIPMTQLYPSTGLATPTLVPTLSNSTNLMLNWAGTFNLLSATNITGPWTIALTNGVGPYSTSTKSAPRKFFRLVDPVSP